MELLLYLLSNLFRVYAMYKFQNVFFSEAKCKRLFILLSYGAFFVVNSLCYLWYNQLAMNMMTNILPFFLISFLYRTKTSTRCISTCSIYAVGMFCDACLFAISKLLPINNILFTSGFATAVLLYFFALLFGGIFRIRNRNSEQFGITYFLALLFIPIGSIVVANVTMTAFDARSIIAAFILLCINAMVFYLYDVLLASQEKLRERDLLAQQTKFYKNQLFLMEKSQEQLSCLRHDMRNHINCMAVMLEAHDYDGLQDYLKCTEQSVSPAHEYLKTGNTDIDCLVNYKLNEAAKQSAMVSAKAVMPPELFISSFDITVMLGNLLDNAIEAMENCENRQLELCLTYKKNVFTITVRNSYCPAYFAEKGTSKPDKAHHGFGLKSIRNAANKYNGELETQRDDTFFTAKVLLYNA